MSGKEVVKDEPVEAQLCGNESEYDRSELPELLRIYYGRLFPYDKYCDWLQYGVCVCV